jgi:hypothetical protein
MSKSANRRHGHSEAETGRLLTAGHSQAESVSKERASAAPASAIEAICTAVARAEGRAQGVLKLLKRLTGCTLDTATDERVKHYLASEYGEAFAENYDRISDAEIMELIIDAETRRLRTIDPPRDDGMAKTRAMASHAPDYRSVHWFGADYQFTGTQAACVKILWEAWENKTPEVGDMTILDMVGTSCTRLNIMFRGHAAWGTMIRSGRKGSHRLAAPHN